MKYLNKPILGTQLNWSHPLNKGLVGFWLFNEGHGNKVNDLSMNGNTGTCIGMADPPTTISGWNPGRTGTGLNFDGGNDYMSLSSFIPEINVSSSYSIALDINPNNVTADQIILVNTISSSNRIAIRIFNGHIRVGHWNGTSYGTSLKSGIVVQNNVNKILYTYNQGTSYLYINNVNQSGVLSTTVFLTAGFRIGSSTTNVLYYNGSVDEVRIYNHVLSAAEILQLYTEPYCMFL